MITSRQLYEDSIDNIFSFYLDENIEEMTHQYEQQYLCHYHRKKHRHHRNKLNNNNHDKYVC